MQAAKLHSSDEAIMLLRFRTTNYRSIRDSCDLVMTKASFNGIRPEKGKWSEVTNRIAGIFGPNASGKTTVLDSMAFSRNAIGNSASWTTRQSFPHHPFLLDGISSSAPSIFEMDFVYTGVRHSYGFESNERGVQAEWLHTYPEGRRRVLFEREKEDYTFGRHLKGENTRISRLTSEMNLFLSMSAFANHPYMRGLRQFLINHFDYAVFSESSQNGRIRAVKKWIESDHILRRAENLLRFADLGIKRLSIENVEVAEEVQRTFRKAFLAFNDESDNEKAEEAFTDFLKEQQVQIGFWHEGGGDDKAYQLDINKESSGTVAWLALALPALRIVDMGGTFFVDEIDASLHPRLTSALISLFKSDELNPKGAQLVFTSHDTSLMGHLTGETLDAEEIWFAEKANDGSTEIYPLTDFQVKPDHNVERRYLGGRYGAIPSISWEDLQVSLLEDAQA
ncbi:ATP-binding protein [Streptomyces sp. SID3212]|uniref:AAA family ATPase n=1 Tax=Streptomyces sp. SID3212 TaxID=2690259 RepID=UPI001368CBAD|nr:ATP-binding protein [Streptomyces sp. SID3212]MYV53873.1 AAA family ATPase [Streptomyces sp. SID3212]